MKVLQLLPTLAMGDAIGNDVRALDKVIRGMGYQTGIYAEVIDGRLPEGTAQQVEKMPRLSGEDVILYHMSTGSELNFSLEKYPCRKLMVFHNITPPRFFKGYNEAAMESAEYGMRGLCHLADKVDGCMADSAYNGDVLRELNYRCPITVRPILIPFADYAKTPDQSVMEHYQDDGYTNFIFVGRVAIRSTAIPSPACSSWVRTTAWNGITTASVAMWERWNWTTWSLRGTFLLHRFWHTIIWQTCSCA